MEDDLQKLKEILAEIDDIMRAAAVLGWDQQTYMPMGGIEARARQLATLEQLAHNRFVSDEVGQLLEDLRPLAATEDFESDTVSLIRVATRDYEREGKVPGNLVAELAHKTALAHSIWEQAREEHDFSRFQPILEKLVDLVRRKAEHLGYTDHIYDPLLDLYEPEMKTAEVTGIFKQFRTALIPLIQQIAERQDALQDRVFQRNFDLDKQWNFTIEVLRRIGYDFNRGRQDKSAHPFTTSFSPDDVRITTRLDPNYFHAGIFGSIHEGGHGMYEQGISKTLGRTLLGNGASSAVHESQSRFWENVIGRSREFWSYFLPHLKQLYSDQLAEATVEQVYQAVNIVRPGYIRVDADEVTYNLHIFLRFELETVLIAGDIEVEDLPELWNSKMKAYLGLTPPNDTLGVLQDMHWSSAVFGYFPTYTLGNILSLQFCHALQKALPDFRNHIACGDFAPILQWLRDHIYVHGKKFTPKELVRRVTGETINPQAYITYLQTKYGELYGFSKV